MATLGRERRAVGVDLCARHDLVKRFALVLVGTLVDDHLADAAALVDRARPTGEETDAHAIEGNIAEVPFLDIEHVQPLALVIGRRRVELVRAAVVAISDADLGAFDLPVDIGHQRPL